MHRYRYGSGLSSYGWSPTVKALIAINCVVFLLDIFIPALQTRTIFGLTPAHVTNRLYVWQLFTYMFLHGGFFHLLFNMFVLWMFGSEIEGMWGRREFLRYYIITGIGAGVLTVITSWNSQIPTVGASGAIYGILVAFAVLFPNRLIYLYFLFPIKAKHLIILFALLELLASRQSSESGIANFAHLGGMLVGYIYLKGGAYFSHSLDGMKGRIRSSKIKIKIVDDGESRRDRDADGKEDDEINSILDKILRDGIDSLSEKEKDTLNRASSRFRNKR